MKVKDEPVDESSSRDSRKRSSDQSSSNVRKRHDSGHKSISRERSFERRDFRPRNRSPPPRRRSPPPRRGAATFLDELREKFQGKDTSFIDNFDRHGNDRTRGRNNQNQYGTLTFSQQQQNIMMNEFQQQQMMPNMMPMNYQQFNPSMQFDPYNQMMMPQTQMIDEPQPVPPPAPGTMDYLPHQYLSPELPSISPPLMHQQIPQNNNGNIGAKKQSNNAMRKVNF